MLCRVLFASLFLLGFQSITLGQGVNPGVGVGVNTSAGNSGGIRQNSAQTAVQNNTVAPTLDSATGFLGGSGETFSGANLGGGGFLAGGGANAANNAANRAGAANRGGGQFGNFGNFGGGQGGRGGQFGGRGFQLQQRLPTRIVRTRITVPVDFAAPSIPSPAIQNRLGGQFDRIRVRGTTARPTTAARQAFWNSSISIVTDGPTVTLQGVVATERDRKLAEKIAKLEPGVGQVQNELSVLPPLPE